jgi:hypothetical protein
MATIRASVRFWCHDPAVYAFTDAEIDRFLVLEKVNDEDGYHPAESNWTPTYDVLRAAGRAWLWLAGLAANKPLSYKAGDVTVMVDKNYCHDRAKELMGSSSAGVTRADEPKPEQHRIKYHDGIDPRHES